MVLYYSFCQTSLLLVFLVRYSLPLRFLLLPFLSVFCGICTMPRSLNRRRRNVWTVTSMGPRLKAPPRPPEPKALQALSIFSPKYDVSAEILMKVVRAFQWEPKDFEPEASIQTLNPNLAIRCFPFASGRHLRRASPDLHEQERFQQLNDGGIGMGYEDRPCTLQCQLV